MNATTNTSDYGEDYDYNDFANEWEGVSDGRKLISTSIAVFLSSVVFGTIFNITAIVVLVRRRLWRDHEGYLYLLAIFVGNLVIAIDVFIPHLLYQFPNSFRLEAASNFTCKMWRFLFYAVFSTGWYTSALLLNVCLRGHLAHSHCCACWRRLASKYCTVVGSLVANGVLTFCFVITDCWTLWNSEVFSVHDEQFCHTTMSHHGWLYVIAGFQWLVPVCFVIPVLWVVAVWTHCKQGTGFSFVLFGEEDQNDEAKEFARLSTIVGAAVFVIQFPMIVVEFWVYTHADFHPHAYTIVKCLMLVFCIHIVVVPLCCFVSAKRMREELIMLLKCVCCNRKRQLNDISPILPLDSVENATSEKITTD